MSKRPLLIGLVLLAVCAAAPFFFYPVFLMKVLCFALLASALNLLVGYVGLLSFGHAMFFGGAAYVAGYTIKVWHWDPLLAILAGGVVAGLLAGFVGLLAIRRHGIYFSMITLAFAQLVYFVCLRVPATGGENGIQDIPRGTLLGWLDLSGNMTLYYVVLAITGLGIFLVYRIVHSPFGQVLKAIRDNEQRVESLGYPVRAYKHLAFMLSGALAGVAGATKVLVFQIATLQDVMWHTSGEAVLMVIVGGLQTMLGPLAGALMIVSMHNAMAWMAEWVLVIQGAVFILFVMLCRRGIVGQIAWWWRDRERTS
ncbi:branched-chain amino acid ABC transporter permease [Achromobacter sp. GG226]|uniref:branched-chain amino acid ABC transporter permease n=1 Tax=Verticiella alkaliphila TaxID=2779529 RepID=UPI001C0D2C17|nr:branched-chain amino acid ABC transporter permease [Verticiella sp. GG226]MBU4610411.1 branched-chain amino acid ABC transporter permease [Verticiella sp. GG226]